MRSRTSDEHPSHSLHSDPQSLAFGLDIENSADDIPLLRPQMQQAFVGLP